MLFFPRFSLPMRVGTHRLPIRQLGAGRGALALAAVLISGVALAQSSALMDACNAVNDKEQRLACFKELMDLKAGSAQGNEAAGKRVKSAFASVAGAVGSGVSYNSYATLILEPAKELEVFRREHPSASPVAVLLFDQALVAYRDAQKVWHSSIYLSRDAGAWGRILDVADAQLGDIVYKYKLALQTRLLSKHLNADAALSEIWKYADQRARLATDVLDGRVAATSVTITCDQWGNPKDAEGNPCTP